MSDMSIPGRKIALIGPSFFSYVQTIRAKLEERGLHVDFFDERHANSISAKIYYRTALSEIFPATRRRHVQNLAQKIVANQYTDVLLINPEVCDDVFIQTVKANGAKVHFYTWDSFHNKPRFRNYLELLDGKGTFDPVDADRYGLTYIPLFGEDAFSLNRNGGSGSRNIDVAFCGTLHSTRSYYLARLDRVCRKKGATTRLLNFFHSKGLLLLQALRRPSHLYFFSTVSTRPFPKAEVADTFFRAHHVFDVPHPRQQGLTARTFEALRSGARLITFNPQARTLPAELLNRVLILKDIRELENIDFAATVALEPLNDAMDYYLSIDRFIDNLLELAEIEPAMPPVAH